MGFEGIGINVSDWKELGKNVAKVLGPIVLKGIEYAILGIKFIVKLFGFLIKIIKPFIKVFAEGIGNIFGGIKKIFGGSIMEGLMQLAWGFLQTAKFWFFGLVDMILGFFGFKGSLGEKIYGLFTSLFGEKFVDSIIGGFKATVKFLDDSISYLANKFLEFADWVAKKFGLDSVTKEASRDVEKARRKALSEEGSAILKKEEREREKAKIESYDREIEKAKKSGITDKKTLEELAQKAASEAEKQNKLKYVTPFLYKQSIATNRGEMNYINAKASARIAFRKAIAQGLESPENWSEWSGWSDVSSRPEFARYLEENLNKAANQKMRKDQAQMERLVPGYKMPKDIEWLPEKFSSKADYEEYLKKMGISKVPTLDQAIQKRSQTPAITPPSTSSKTQTPTVTPPSAPSVGPGSSSISPTPAQSGSPSVQPAAAANSPIQSTAAKSDMERGTQINNRLAVANANSLVGIEENTKKQTLATNSTLAKLDSINNNLTRIFSGGGSTSPQNPMPFEGAAASSIGGNMTNGKFNSQPVRNVQFDQAI